mgnify:CR=1 FL=1
MSGNLFVNLAKLKGSGHLLIAARHNKRETQAEHGASSAIDPQRSRLNYCLAGEATAAAVTDKATRLRKQAGVTRIRRDAVQAIEVLFSLPFKSTIDPSRYFADCTRWAGDQFGHNNILSSDVHLDEAAPHCHVLIVPLHEGAMRGSALVGGPHQLRATRDDFFAKVGSQYGLSAKSERLTGKRKQITSDAVLKRLESDSDAATRSKVWPIIQQVVASDPGPFAQALCIDLPPATPAKSWTDIFTGTGKKTLEDRKTYRLPRPVGASKPILCRLPASDAVSASKAANESAKPLQKRQ